MNSNKIPEDTSVGKLNDHLIGLEQKGKPAFSPTPLGANDAHGEDDLKEVWDFVEAFYPGYSICPIIKEVDRIDKLNKYSPFEVDKRSILLATIYKDAIANFLSQIKSGGYNIKEKVND
jgi:hypothetical protein